jgi:hypothetical protein
MLASSLGIPRHALDAAAAEIKGLRVYPTGRPGEVARMLDDVRASFALAANDLTPDELAEIGRQMDVLDADVRRARQARGDSR